MFDSLEFDKTQVFTLFPGFDYLPCDAGDRAEAATRESVHSYPHSAHQADVTMAISLGKKYALITVSHVAF